MLAHQRGMRGLDLDKYKTDVTQNLGLLGHQRGLQGLELDKYRADINQNLGLLAHQRGIADLGIKQNYLDIASQQANPYSSWNLAGRVGDWLGSGGASSIVDWFTGGGGQNKIPPRQTYPYPASQTNRFQGYA